MVETILLLEEDSIDFLAWATKSPYGATVMKLDNRYAEETQVITFRMTDYGVASKDNIPRLDARGFYVKQRIENNEYDGNVFPTPTYQLDSVALHETLSQMSTPTHRRRYEGIPAEVSFELTDGVRSGFDAKGKPIYETPPTVRCVFRRGEGFTKTLQCVHSSFGTSPFDFGERMEFDKQVLRPEYQSYGTQHGGDKAMSVVHKDGLWVFIPGTNSAIAMVNSPVSVDGAQVDEYFALDNHLITQIRAFASGHKSMTKEGFDYWLSCSEQRRGGEMALAVAFEISAKDGSCYLSVSGPCPEVKVPNMAIVMEMPTSAKVEVMPDEMADVLSVAMSVCDKDNRPCVGVLEIGNESIFVGGAGQAGNSENLVAHTPVSVKRVENGSRFGCGVSMATLKAAFDTLENLKEGRSVLELKRRVGQDYPDNAVVVSNKNVTFFLSGNSAPGPYDCYKTHNPLYNGGSNADQTS